MVNLIKDTTVVIYDSRSRKITNFTVSAPVEF